MEYSFEEFRAKILESFDYFEYLNSISFHPPAMIITTLVLLLVIANYTNLFLNIKNRKK